MEEEKKVQEAVAEQAPAQEAAPAEQPKEGRPERRDRRDNRRGDRKGGPRDRRDRRDEPKEFEERVVFINRVSKTVKGGRRMKFTALVVVGDHKGRYGFAVGKAAEVPDAIKKASEAAKKNLFKIHLVKGATISHEIVGQYGACNVYLKPAPEAAPAEQPKEGRPERRDRRDNRRGDRKGGPRDRRNDRRDEPKEFEERVVFINRVSKTVKGGRRMKFTALVVVGDHKGRSKSVV